MPDIPEIARHFCEFVEPDQSDPLTQPELVEGIESRLKLVAEIWEMITDVENAAASWGGGEPRLANGSAMKTSQAWMMPSPVPLEHQHRLPACLPARLPS